MVVDLDALLRENAAQRAQIAELLATNTKLVSEIAKLNERVGELREDETLVPLLDSYAYDDA